MSWYKPWTWGDESQSSTDKRNDLNDAGLAAGQLAEYGSGGLQAMDAESATMRDALRRRASGADSLSAEQLRQGLGQQLSQQRSMAASASPQNGPMAARTAALAMGRASSGMAGNQAMAGIQERSAAEQALSQMIMQKRQQDLQAALGSRQTQVSAYGGVTPDKSDLDKWGNAVAAGVGMYAKSDERAKTDIKAGDAAARKATDGLKSFLYRYKDEKDGKGEQLGVMAQAMEKSGLGHAVIDTPGGKYVHGGKAATSSLALVAALGRRVDKLESGKK